MEIQCTYSFVHFNGIQYYRCVVEEQEIKENTRLKFVGEHINRKVSVNFVQFKNCRLTKIPQNLTKNFKRMQVLEIIDCSLATINKDDIAEYKNLNTFNCKNNWIEHLPGDLFEGFKNLERIDFWNNELEIIEPNILNGLTKLEFVNFGKPGSFFQFSIYGGSSSRTLEEFQQLLNDNYQSKIERQQEAEESEEEDEEIEKDEEILAEIARNLEKALLTAEKDLKQENLNNIKLTEKIKKLEQEKIKDTERIKKLEQENLKTIELSEKLKELEEEKLKSTEWIKKLEKENIALIQQNLRLTDSEVDLKTELLTEKLKTSRYAQKLEKGILSDVIDLIQDETTRNFNININDQQFPVHKFLLEARSSTLAEVLRNNPEAQQINLTDIEADVFEKIHHFLYTDELPLCQDGISYQKLFTAAGMLKIGDLKYIAGVNLCNNIRKENAIEILKLSAKFEHQELKDCTFREIQKFYPNIEFEDNWINDVKKLIEAIEPKSKRRISRIPVRVSSPRSFHVTKS